MLIRDLMQRNLDERIEEIIQVANDDAQLVHDEITEYITTTRIREHYREVLKAIAESPTSATTEFEVWISGFFGSGKSSFAKLLGYTLSNPILGGDRAAEVFKRQVNDPQISALVDNINARLPFEVIMFDVQTSRNMHDASEDLGSLMYREMLRHLGYCESDLVIARLEMELESDGNLAAFEQICLDLYGKDWRALRKLTTRLNRASTILHKLDPQTFPQPETWANTAERAEGRVSVEVLVRDTLDLLRRRRPGRALAFVIDEVGQYVATSNAKIENLRAIVETFGRESQRLVRTGQLSAPVWTVITSQERLDQIVSALGNTEVGIAKVQDRFRHKVDLAPADIREVASRRVLSKRPTATAPLTQLFTAHQGQLHTACKLEKSKRTQQDFTSDTFAQFYPYLPHFIDLSIDIVSGLRTQGTQLLHIGGSNRTIIKQVHEMLISDRTHFATREVGALVALDQIYELVETSIASEKQRDISTIAERHGGHSGWAARVAKAICLLENVKDLPRSPANIAALLIGQIGQTAPLSEVRQALKELEEAGYVREHETGYKLVTALERSWDDERKALPHPNTREQHAIRDDMLKEIFSDNELRIIKFGPRTFRIGLRIDEQPPELPGNLDLRLLCADDAEDLPQRQQHALTMTRDPAHHYEIYWVFLLSDDAQRLIREIHASRVMIARHQHEGAQGLLSDERKLMHSEEATREAKLKDAFKAVLRRDLHVGRGIFRGVTTPGGSLGQTLHESIRKQIQDALPSIYPHFELGNHAIGANDIESFLKASNLSALPQVFYQTGLVTHQGPNNYVIDPNAAIAGAVLAYLQQQRTYSHNVTGKDITANFSEGPGYGWDADMAKLVLAVLVRNGNVEITTAGRRYQNHSDPKVREAFTGSVAFRSASFAPHQPLERKVLREAFEAVAKLSGKDPTDVNPMAIASAAREIATKEAAQVATALVLADAHKLPIMSVLHEYQGYLRDLAQAADEDATKMLAERGASIIAARTQAIRLHTLLTEENIASVNRARTALRDHAAALALVGEPDAARDAADRLRDLLAQPDVLEALVSIRDHTATIHAAYAHAYLQRHSQCADVYRDAIARVRNDPDWDAADPVKREAALMPLAPRACRTTGLAEGALTCAHCQRPLATLQTDLEFVSALRQEALAKVHAALPVEALAEPAPTPTSTVRDQGPHWNGATNPRPTNPPRAVRAASYFRAPLATRQEVEVAVATFREALLRVIESGDEVRVE